MEHSDHDYLSTQVIQIFTSCYCFTSCDAVTIFAPVATRSRAHCKETVAGHTSLSTALVKRNVKLQIHDK